MVVCGAVVVTVMVVVTIVLAPFPVADGVPQLASEGKPVQVKLTAVVKLLDAMMPMVVVPDPPGLAMVTLAKPATPVNPGWIVKVTGAVLLLGLKLGSPA